MLRTKWLVSVFAGLSIAATPANCDGTSSDGGVADSVVSADSSPLPDAAKPVVVSCDGAWRMAFSCESQNQSYGGGVLLAVTDGVASLPVQHKGTASLLHQDATHCAVGVWLATDDALGLLTGQLTVYADGTRRVGGVFYADADPFVFPCQGSVIKDK